MPVIVHRFGCVFDRYAGVLQAVAELEILVAVAGERFIEPPDAIEVGARHRTVAGHEVEPGQMLARRRMQRVPQGGVAALALVGVVGVDLNLAADHRAAGPLRVPREVTCAAGPVRR